MSLVVAKLVTALASRPIALTTFHRCDDGSANRYQTAVVRGDDELLFWGLGPRLGVGGLVALYVPDSPLVPARDRQAISRVYSIARVLPGEEWPNYVFLEQPLVFEPFRLSTLRRKIGLSDFDIRDAGSTDDPWDEITAAKFWRFVLERQDHLGPVARERLLRRRRTRKYDVAISYAGPDWTEARRLKRWFDHEGLRTFFATSVGTLDDDGREALPALLQSVYHDARVTVFVAPPSDYESEWLPMERDAAKRGAGHVMLVRFDASRRWPQRRGRGVEKLEYRLPGEDAIVKAVLSRLGRRRGRRTRRCPDG